MEDGGRMTDGEARAVDGNDEGLTVKHERWWRNFGYGKKDLNFGLLSIRN